MNGAEKTEASLPQEKQPWKGTRFWEWLGKIAALLALILTVFSILNFLKPSEYSLSVIGSHSPYFIPKEMMIDLNSLESAFDTSSLKEDYIHSAAAPVVGDLKVVGLVDYISYYFNESYPSSMIKQMNGTRSVWFFKIRNNGYKEIPGLKLELPFEGLFSISKVGEDTVSHDFKNIISLGNLRPKNEINVTVWSTLGSEDYWEKDTRVTHSNGVYSVKYPVHLTGFYEWVARSYPSEYFQIVLFIIMVAILVGIFYLGVALERERIKKLIIENKKKAAEQVK